MPTWNYTAVHCYGKPRVIEDRDALLAIVQKLIQFYEQTMPRPWSFDGSGSFAERMLAQIVGFDFEIEKIEGKWKLNQNQPVERRRKVIRALQERSDENSQAVAGLMRTLLPAEN